jgi:hypothetical protein
MNLVEYLGIGGGRGGKIKISPNDNGYESMGGFNWLRMTKHICEHVNEHFGFTKGAALNHCQLFQKDPAT